MLLTSALLPYFAENFRQGTLGGLQGNCAAAMRVIGFLVFPACFGTAAVLPVLLPLLFGQAFAGAVPAATVLVLAGALGGTASVGTSLIMATDHSDFIFFSGTAAAMLMVAAGFSLIPMFGVMGAAWVRATIQLLMVAVSGWFITRRLQLSLPLFDLGKLLIAAALCGSAARACLWWVPGAGSLPLAIFVGSAVYIVSVRLMHGLPKNDADWLRSVCRRLPAWSHNAVDLGFRVIVPNVSAAAPDIRSARNAN
jgi:O-antigen/teichoic acid export membrane protein